MLFSIVIPAYNYGHVLGRAVESACSQPGDDYEVLVIDDGSTDETPSVLGRLQQQFPALRVIRQENAGLAAVRNRGVAESLGDYLLFLDADDELLPGALAAFRDAVDKNPDAGMLIAPTESVFPDGRTVIGRSPAISPSAEQRFLDFLYKRLRLANGAVAMHRRVFDNIRYNPALRQTEDIPVFSYCLASFDCQSVGEPTTRIYKHESSMRHDIETALRVGMSLVDEVFDAARLPPVLMRHRKRYLARRSLSLFRLCYRAGRYREARTFYREAWRSNPVEILRKPETLIKFLRCFAGGVRH